MRTFFILPALGQKVGEQGTRTNECKPSSPYRGNIVPSFAARDGKTACSPRQNFLRKVWARGRMLPT